MGYAIEKQITRPGMMRQKLSLSEKLAEQVKKDREEVFDIFEGRDPRKILIVGPCSAWPAEAIVDYATKLKAVSDKVKDKIKVIMRVYTQKPRTTLGWTGPINQPDPFKEPDLEKGITYCRQMMLDVLEAGIPVADEALFTHNEGYFADLISWIAIGARSGEDQEHRIYASLIAHPVGIKNPTAGNLDIATNSVLAAQNSHVFQLGGRQIRTTGNPHAHLVLRGGAGKANCDAESMRKALDLMNEKKIKNASIIVDASHDNSIDPKTGKKDPLLQPEILLDVVKSMKQDGKFMDGIKGFMIESFIKPGKQDMKKANSLEELDVGGLSVTDGCIGIDATKELIEKLGEEL